MTHKDSSSTNTLVLAAIIGALGGILAACIGLVPTILPMIRPSPTQRPFDTAIFVPTDTQTPVPDTATVTLPATEMSTLTATLEPLPTDTPVTETATITATSIPPSADMEAYLGTWTNIDKNPKSDKVRLVVTRIDISQTADAAPNFSVCRDTKSAERYVVPNPAAASILPLGLGANEFTIESFPDLRWAIEVQRTADQLVATVHEYDLNNILLASDTFNLERASLLDLGSLIPCKEPAPSP